MLSVSLSIKTLTTNIISARDKSDYPTLFTNLGTLIRLIAFFKSSNSESLEPAPLENEIPNSFEINNEYVDLDYNFRGRNLESYEEEEHFADKREIYNLGSSEPYRSDLHVEYVDPNKPWIWSDYFQFISGVLEGATGAIPSNTMSVFCSTNTTLFRTSLLSSVIYFDQQD